MGLRRWSNARTSNSESDTQRRLLCNSQDAVELRRRSNARTSNSESDTQRRLLCYSQDAVGLRRRSNARTSNCDTQRRLLCYSQVAAGQNAVSEAHNLCKGLKGTEREGTRRGLNVGQHCQTHREPIFFPSLVKGQATGLRLEGLKPFVLYGH